MTAHSPMRTDAARAGRELRRTRDRAAIERDLRRQLAILAARHETGEMDEPQIGMVLQAHRNINGSYATWRASWHRRLRQMKGPDGVGTLSAENWPEQLIEDGSCSACRPGRHR